MQFINTKQLYNQPVSRIKNTEHSYMFRQLSLVMYREYQYLNTFTALSYVNDKIYDDSRPITIKKLSLEEAVGDRGVEV